NAISITQSCRRTLRRRRLFSLREMFWLGGRDSNPDSQIQSLESYHWTTSQRRIRIYGSLTFKSTEPFKRGGLCFNLYAPLRVPRYFAAVTSKKVLALGFVSNAK